MKKNKLLMAIATLFLVMTFTVIGGTTCEAARKSKEFNSGDLYYRTISGNQVEVLGTKKRRGTLTIPSYVTYKGKNYKVTGIAEGVGDSLGILCYTKIKKVVLPNTLTYIGDAAFGDSTELKEVVFAKKYHKLTIGKGAFQGCYELKKIAFPEGTYELKENAIGEIPEIYIPSTVKKIGARVVNNCTKKVTISKKNKKFKMKDGILYSYDEKKLISASAKVKKNVKISSKTKTIGKNAFESAWGIKSIALNKNITTIPKGAFYHCDNLKKVTNADKIKKIDASAFRNCFKLNDMGKLSNLTTIGAWSLANVGKINITISSKMKIHNRAFGNSAFSMNVKVAENDPVYSIVNGFLIKKAGTKQIVILQTEDLEEVIIPEGTTHIETILGSHTMMKKITFPETVKEINDDIHMKLVQEEYGFNGDAEGAIYFKGMIPPRFPKEFASSLCNKTIYVPKGTLEAYREAIEKSEDIGWNFDILFSENKVTFEEY